MHIELAESSFNPGALAPFVLPDDDPTSVLISEDYADDASVAEVVDTAGGGR